MWVRGWFPVLEMLVEVYSPSGGYGFCVGGDSRVYFAADAFVRATDGPPPIAGERVEVHDVRPRTDTKQADKARRVVRLDPPLKVVGRVRSFDHRAGWGFADGTDGKQYFLHRSDMRQPWLPAAGDGVEFFAGLRNNKPRACYAQPVVQTSP